MRVCVLLSLVAIALASAAPAAAAPRLVTIATPSANVESADVTFNPGGALKANVLLPDGYDQNPRKRYPVMYLLHGVGDNHRAWVERGDVIDAARNFPGIIVMPEGARGFYLNWWRDGARAKPGWERFFLDELVPQIERRFRVRAGRRWHALTGLSMGGLGAAYLAGQAPGYFGSVALLSPFIHPDNSLVHTFFQTIIPEAKFSDIWGPPDGFYAVGHDPTETAGNLRHHRLWVTVGDGTPEPAAGDSPQAIVVGGFAEAAVVRPQVDEFVANTRAVGANVTFVPRHGIHEWSYYWRRALREALAWNVFAPVAGEPAQWDYQTTATHGQAWSVRYRFTRPPNAIAVIRRNGRRLRVTGATSPVRLWRAKGCGVTVKPPWSGPLPPSKCRKRRR